MLRPRASLWVVFLAIAGCFPVSAQTVISAHSGLLYFFEGTVFLGGERLEQKFGRFPDIGEGRELRTENGRAEVLLTPGVLLRIADKSAIKMISEKLADTRVELLSGSAILEVNQNAPGTAVTLMYRTWQIQTPDVGVYRIDSAPAQVQVYKGRADVVTEGKSAVTVNDGETLQLTAVLVPEPSPMVPGDAFKTWAMNRSQAVSADNAIAGEIVDDPSQMDTSTGLDLGGFTYFPLTGVPSLGISNPYGVSFWSPFQPLLYSSYFPSFMYSPYYLGWPTGMILYPRSIMPSRIGIGTSRIGVPGRSITPIMPRTGVPPRLPPSMRSPSIISAPRAPISAPRPAPIAHPAAPMPHTPAPHR